VNAVFGFFRGKKGLPGDGVPDSVDGDGSEDGADQVSDGDQGLGLGNGLQTGHVIFFGIFHGVDQSGGCGGGHL
jgi:hypothetical protein